MLGLDRAQRVIPSDVGWMTRAESLAKAVPAGNRVLTQNHAQCSFLLSMHIKSIGLARGQQTLLKPLARPVEA